jgi:hypothetical protein
MNNLIKEKDRYYNESYLLRQEANKTDNFDKSQGFRKKQDIAYKKFVFYSNIIKANDKISRDK